VKVRQAGRIVSVAVIIAVAVNTNGVREIADVAVGPSEAEPFWLKFLRDLTRRGLRGVKLLISDAHLGLKAAIAKVFNATWQRCRVHFMRNALAYANKGQRQMVLALINTAFAQETTEAAHEQWRVVADHFRPKLPKLATLLDEAQNDVLAFTGFPRTHRKQIASTKPLERVNAEIKRRTDVVGIFPNDAAIVRLVGALLLEQNDEWQLQRIPLARGTRSDQRQPNPAALSRHYGLRSNPRRKSLVHHSAGHDQNIPPQAGESACLSVR
jgi:putative transposase